MPIFLFIIGKLLRPAQGFTMPKTHSLFTDFWLILKTLKLFLKEELFEFGDPTSIILNSKMPPPNSSILRCKAETREGPVSAGHD